MQADDFTHDQFSHTACVGERRVEHGDAGVGRTGQINLIGPDTEAPHSTQRRERVQGLRVQVCPRTNAHSHGFFQRVGVGV